MHLKNVDAASALHSSALEKKKKKKDANSPFRSASGQYNFKKHAQIHTLKIPENFGILIFKCTMI